jgi:hypothetical protein
MGYITFAQFISDSNTTAESANKPKHTEVMFYYTEDMITFAWLYCIAIA